MYIYKTNEGVEVIDARYPEGELTYEANINMSRKIAFERKLNAMIKKARQPLWIRVGRRIASIFI